MSGLSKMQKSILVALGGTRSSTGLHRRVVSWRVAREAPDQRIWSARRQIEQLRQEGMAGKRSMQEAVLLARVIRAGHRRDSHIKAATRVSVSRSIGRLEARGLVEKIRWEVQGGESVYYVYRGPAPAHRVRLTKKGRRLCEEQGLCRGKR